jgi:uncharacterized protein YjbI with pentapeptide repeats
MSADKFLKLQEELVSTNKERAMIDVKSILEKHSKWLRNEEGGVRADLSGLDLHGVDLSVVNLREANMNRVDLHDADLHGSDLREADMHGADLRNAYIGAADLRRADMRWADLSKADLSRANLCEVDMSDANLSRTNLGGADLSGAVLTDVNLRDTNMGGANLREVDLPLGIRIISVAGVGSARRMTTFRVDTDEVWCGCFKGTLKDFAAKIEETHKYNARYLAHYRAVVAMLEVFRTEE